MEALKGVSFEIPRGTVFGILGPNGSGKTTLLGIILDVLNASSGHYTWTNFATLTDARKNIGALLETPNFYPYMSAFDNLKIVCKIKDIGIENIDTVLRQVSLYDRKSSAFSTFSLGMKQRLAIASALLSNPQIVILDEPTNGLDPVGIAEIRNLIVDLREQGKTVIMASHMLDEVEKVCTDVAILQKGNLLMAGSVSDVLSKEEWIEISSKDNKTLENILQSWPNQKGLRRDAHKIFVALAENTDVADLNEYCATNKIYLTHIVSRKASLESKFMELTKN